MKIEESIGETFGRLTIIRKTTKGNCLCKCKCGKEKETLFYRVKTGKTKSCGCLTKELMSRKMTTHGGSDTRLYRILNHMKNRCYKEKTHSYKWYGAKGIKVHDEWLNDFLSFRDWAINNGYEDDLTIDRINPEGNYEPSNCQWIPNKKQAANKRDSLFVEYRGERLCLTDMCRKYGLNDVNVRQYRRKYKMPPLEAFIDFILRRELGMSNFGRLTDKQIAELGEAKRNWMKENGRVNFE